MTRKRSAAIIIQDGRIALIERFRPDRHYFVFPGGGMEPDESPESAMIREVYEELGVHVNARQLVAEMWYHGVPQYYFLADIIGGEFGTGQGEEYTAPQPPEVGSFTPVWMPVAEILRHPVLPSPVAGLVARSHPIRWPSCPYRLFDPDSD